MSNKIRYKTIKELNFSEQLEEDTVFEEEYGYPYKIFEKKLMKNLYIDWDQTTRECTLLRTKKGKIRKETPILNEKELIDIVNFFL
ncbi:MAG: hypothetical protein PF569_01815 [Candidatus Woesearchaeota archaeon]|jgi:hypothetical protein|nr:hypothetical protein [Candidatus Woesearchaeota archaeon]